MRSRDGDSISNGLRSIFIRIMFREMPSIDCQESINDSFVGDDSVSLEVLDEVFVRCSVRSPGHVPERRFHVVKEGFGSKKSFGTE
jgi:hypothetical protein